jgi:lipopolysaccharide transport system permease protein
LAQSRIAELREDASSQVTVLTPAGSTLRPFLSPLHVLQHFWTLRESIARLAQREIARLYAGTALGVWISVLQGLALMAIYVLVFSTVFRARWTYPGVEIGTARFGLLLFSGLITYNLFADCVGRAPLLLHENARLITKVVFPVELLPVALLVRTGFVSAVQLALLLVAVLVTEGRLPATALLGLVMLASLALFTLGAAYVVAAVGTYYRDVAHGLTVALRALMFATPVFYAVDGLGPRIQAVLQLNPLTWAVESARTLFVLGVLPPPGYLWALLLSGPLCFYFGLLFFMKLRKGFRDVV